MLHWESLEEAVAYLTRRYSPDIGQQAAWLTLRRAPTDPIGYALRVGHILHDIHYDDGLASFSRRGSWHREARQIVDARRQPLWMVPSPDPERVAMAREGLRRLPGWLIRLHLDDDLVCRRPCWVHPLRWWYPYRASDGVRIRCRGCFVERQRERNRRRDGNPDRTL